MQKNAILMHNKNNRENYIFSLHIYVKKLFFELTQTIHIKQKNYY
jgi:hypothetical protein